MNKLLKYVLIVLIFVFVSFILVIGSNFYRENYYAKKEIEKIHNTGQLVPAPPLYLPLLFLGVSLFYLTGLITFLLSSKYTFKNPNLKDYFKSFSIPSSFIIFTFMAITVISKTTSIYSGESGMAAGVIMLISIGVLALNVLTNLIIYFIKKD